MRMTFDEPIADVPEDAAVSNSTKVCPFCAETILAAAVKCRYCHEFLTEQAATAQMVQGTAKPDTAPQKWYHSTFLLIAAIATLGPMALPMVWTNPKYRPLTKVLITVGVFSITAVFCYAMVATMTRFIIKPIQEMGLGG